MNNHFRNAFMSSWVCRCASVVGGILIAMVAVCMAACSSGKSQQAQAATTPHNVTLTASQQTSIRLYSVATSDYHTTLDTSGVVDFDHDQSTTVLAPFSGSVTKLLVSLGQKVHKGEGLATVTSPDFAAAAAAYRSALANAHAADQLAATDRDLARHDAVSQRENNQAQADAVTADANRDAALQALRALHVDSQTIADIRQGKSVDYAAGVIRAPIDGTVVDKLITPGELLQAGSTVCFTVANLSRVWVMAQIFGTDVDSIHPGDTAEVADGSDSHSLAGKVTNLAAAIDPDTQSVLARVVVDNPGDVLKKQMYVSVRIRSEDSRSGLLVPVSAILHDDENLPFVYVAQPDGSYARRHVTLGYRDGNRIVITDGLQVGDKIVVDGGIFLRFIETQ